MKKILLVHYGDGTKALYEGTKKVFTWEKHETTGGMYDKIKEKYGGQSVELLEKTVKDGTALKSSRPKMEKPPKEPKVSPEVVEDENES